MKIRSALRYTLGDPKHSYKARSDKCQDVEHRKRVITIEKKQIHAISRIYNVLPKRLCQFVSHYCVKSSCLMLKGPTTFGTNVYLICHNNEDHNYRFSFLLLLPCFPTRSLMNQAASRAEQHYVFLYRVISFLSGLPY